jgi:uncharacterized membrane protein
MKNNQNEGGILTTQRLEAFSDSVFAIVITLLFLDLKAPEIPHDSSWQELWSEIYKLMPKFLSILVSFTFVAIFWVAHHQFFHTLRQTTRGLLWLNLVFLFLVCFVPFPASIMAEYPNNKTSVVFFGVAVLLTSVLLLALRWYAWIKHREISGVTKESDVYKAMRRSYLIVGCYIAGLVVSFFSPIAAIVMYLLTPLGLLFPVSISVESEEAEGEGDDDQKKAGEEEVKL